MKASGRSETEIRKKPWRCDLDACTAIACSIQIFPEADRSAVSSRPAGISYETWPLA